jgi:hypothetical protein
MAIFRLTATVYNGTIEELVLRLIAMLEGTRALRKSTNRGMVSHLVQNDRRVDICAMLSSVGLNVTNTNPAASFPMQSFITEGGIIATTPCHRDEHDALLVQLRGSKELLMYPPARSMPGCPAGIYDSVAGSSKSCWL